MGDEEAEAGVGGEEADSELHARRFEVTRDVRAPVVV